jgi:hypothetical protein
MFMLRAFLVFPTGSVGIALAAFRIGVGALFLTSVLPFRGMLISGWGKVTLIFIAVFVLLGALTPYLYFVCSIVEVTKLVSLTGMKAFQLGALILITASLAIVGPGAYSLDAVLFGQRRVIVPGKHDG